MAMKFQGKKSFLVIGLGRFGMSVVRTLESLKCDCIAVDRKEVVVQKATDITNQCIICDSTKLDHLIDIGAKNVDHAIVAIGNNMQATILTTINLKELGVKKITVRIDEREYVSVMEKLGATEVIIPEEASAISLAHQIVSDNFLDYYNISNGYGITQLKVNETFKNKSLVNLNLRNKYDVNIVGLIRNGSFMIPKGTDDVVANDVLLLIGKTAAIMKVDAFLNGK